jgi:hypothetical protein
MASSLDYSDFGAFAKLRRVTISFVCLPFRTRLPLDGFSWKLIFEYFSETYRENISFIKMTRISGTLYEYVCTFDCCILLRARMFQTKVAEEIKTHFTCMVNISPPPPRNRPVYNVYCKRQAKDDWHMRIPCRISKAKKHTQHKIAFPFFSPYSILLHALFTWITRSSLCNEISFPS